MLSIDLCDKAGRYYLCKYMLLGHVVIFISIAIVRAVTTKFKCRRGNGTCIILWDIYEVNVKDVNCIRTFMVFS